MISGMKIYSKETFAYGLFAVVLCVLILIGSILNGFDFKKTVLILVCFVLGSGAVSRSLSEDFSKEDRINELDERNILIKLKSRSRSFSLTQAVSFILMIAFFVLGKTSGDETFIAIGLGLGFSISVSVFSEIFTELYYEKRN